MATVIQLNSDVSHGIAQSLRNLQQDFLAKLPEAESATFSMSSDGLLRVEFVVGGVPSEGAENQARITFKIQGGIIPGLKYVAATTNNVRRRNVMAIYGE